MLRDTLPVHALDQARLRSSIQRRAPPFCGQAVPCTTPRNEAGGATQIYQEPTGGVGISMPERMSVSEIVWHKAGVPERLRRIGRLGGLRGS